MCSCWRLQSSKRYLPKEEQPRPGNEQLSLPQVAAGMEWTHIPEPQLTELANFVRQRREHIVIFQTTADVKAELMRNVTENIQIVDLYPAGRAMMNDEEYLVILRDLLNLSNCLDLMEQVSTPYASMKQYFNIYGKVFRLLQATARSRQG
ncbi:hypothetical protein V8C86DRAFT_2862149 [Haematococcus lacustris]